MSLGNGLSPVEEGNPADDSRGFRRSLGQFASGVTVITAKTGDQLGGVTANSFSSVSLDPPLILWSISRTSQSFQVFQGASHFAVNVLASNQIAISSKFARSGPDKFSGVDWQPGCGGAPLLPGVAAQFQCRREAAHSGGDHVIVVGAVEHFARFDRAPLLFTQGRYSLAVSHPEVASETGGGSRDTQPLQPMFLNLMRRAVAQLSVELQDLLSATGLTINQSRILANLAYSPGASIEQMAEAALLGVSAAEDAAEVLVAQGYAAPGPSRTLMITDAGYQRFLALRGEALACEAKQLAGVPADDVEAARRVLKALGTDHNHSRT